MKAGAAEMMSWSSLPRAEKYARVVPLYRDGMTCREIGERFGVGKNAVTKILYDARLVGIDTSRQRAAPVKPDKPPRRDPQETVRRIVALRREGMAGHAIARHLRMCKQKVSAILWASGFKPLNGGFERLARRQMSKPRKAAPPKPHVVRRRDDVPDAPPPAPVTLPDVSAIHAALDRTIALLDARLAERGVRA